jgi:AcrR family transcriptional regulator
MPLASLRERKKVDTRRTISRAALQLAAERGPDAITVEDIAAAADVSPRTVFNYFASKEEAIVGFDPHRAIELSESVLDRPASESPLVALRAVFVALATDIPELAKITRGRSDLVRTHPQLQPHYIAGYTALERALVDAVAQRTAIDPDRSVYPRLVVATAIAAFRIALDRARPGAAALVRAIDEAFDALESGLRPPR